MLWSGSDRTQNFLPDPDLEKIIGIPSGDKIFKTERKKITYFSTRNTPKSLKIKETKSAIYKDYTSL